MIPFQYRRATTPEQAVQEGSAAGAKFLGGGTNLVDLMKLKVELPTALVDVTRLNLTRVENSPSGGVMIGALVRNSDLANHPRIVKDYPLLSQALLSGASPQIRNMATVGGNLLQRTRCYYFMDTAYTACNKRNAGSGCAAVEGSNRIHAILGQSDHGATSGETCIATNPSDMNVALAALGASIHVQGPGGKRVIPISGFHRLPGTTPQLDTTLRADELITGVELPAPLFAANSWYLKVRDRQSYAFALVSVAAGLEMHGGTIRSAALALGGVAHKPWRIAEAEQALAGARPEPETFRRAAEIAIAGAKGYEHNGFKIEMAKQSVVRALTLATRGGVSVSGPAVAAAKEGRAAAVTVAMRSDAHPPAGSDGAQVNPKQLAERYDGRAKVTGAAKYAVEFQPPVDPVYAFVVTSTIPSGSLVAIDQAAAERAAGVLAVITPFNAPQLPPATPPARRHITVLQEKDVFYSGQPVAVVVAKSLPQAKAAASLLKIDYKRTQAKLNFKDRLGEGRVPVQSGREPATSTRGDVAAAMAKATVKVDQTFTTPYQHHSPMEPHATLAWWEGDKLNVYDSTQSISGCKQTLAKTLGIPIDNVRVQCPYTGGGFGSKGSAWSHVFLSAMAAKVVQKPVKLALERPQMWGPVGGRPNTVQRVQLGATADGKLTAVSHEVTLYSSVMDEFLEPSAGQTRTLYSSEANHAAYKMVDMNLGVATSMRAPGESSGTAALEVALDELAEKLGMDPIELRMVNYVEDDPSTGKPWSSKHLRECYTQAAERFGWSKRKAKPRQIVEGDYLIGYGMATATYHANRQASQAAVQVLADGRAVVRCGSQDLGTGTYTIMAQIAANALGVDPRKVESILGDTMLPKAPGSGGSVSAASIGPAIRDAALKARMKLVQMAAADAQSPLHGAAVDDIEAEDGRLFLKSKPAISDSFADLIRRGGGNPVEGLGADDPGDYHAAMSSGSWGAVFAEVAVDRFTHMPRVRRVVGTYDIGTLLNKTTGLHQLSGGIVWGVSFALFEGSLLDDTYGRFVNNNLGEYHVPVSRDIGEIDVTCLDIPDTRFNSLGARGLGEIGVTGTPAAVANAIYNATGKRIRDYPITPDKIMLA